MSALVIWLDTKEVKFYRLTPNGVIQDNLIYDGPRHEAEVHGRNHPISQTDEERFYHQVAEYLEREEATEWLLLGPGLGKDHFFNHVQSHHPQIRNRFVSIEKADQLSDQDVIARGRSFFRQRQVFQGLF